MLIVNGSREILSTVSSVLMPCTSGAAHIIMHDIVCNIVMAECTCGFIIIVLYTNDYMYILLNRSCLQMGKVSMMGTDVSPVPAKFSPRMVN